jgi:capsular exopolysaccharide synthesis family protein
LELYGGKADSQIYQATQPERLEAARGEYEGLLKMKTRLNSLISEFGVGHPEVSMLMKEIETTEQFFKARSPRLQVSNEQETLTPKSLIEGYVSILRHDLASLDDREKVLIERSKEVEIEAKHLVQFELQGESLRLSVDRQKALFDATVDRLREINLAKDFGGFINELVMEPEVGEEVWPKKSVCGLVGTFGGGLMGLMFGFLFELRNRTLRTLKDIETASGVPNVAMVPKFEQHKDRKARKAIAARKSRVAPIVTTYHFPDCKESELLRGLRTALFFKLSAEGAKVVALTSPSPGDGKSTVTSNLAASIAQAGKSVLLIDADMRRPTQSRLFGETNQRGLADVLSRRASLFESVVHTECPRLDLLTAGAPPSNPAELLASPEFNALVEQARNEYDVVLIDCPPVLAVTDACIVATHADSIMLVVKLNPNSRAELKRSMELLTEVKGNVVGTVLNCSRLESETGRKMDEYGVETYGYGSNRGYEYVRPISVSRDVKGKKPNAVKTPEKTKVS